MAYGLKLVGRRVTFSISAGRLRWLPWRVQDALAFAWNWIACLWLGHVPSSSEPVQCEFCFREVKR